MSVGLHFQKAHKRMSPLGGHHLLPSWLLRSQVCTVSVHLAFGKIWPNCPFFAPYFVKKPLMFGQIG